MGCQWDFVKPACPQRAHPTSSRMSLVKEFDISNECKALFILGPNSWAQSKATNIDQWECPVGQIGLSLGPEGFILRPVPIFPYPTWHPMWRGFGRKELGPCQKLGSPWVGDPIHQLGPNRALAFQLLDSINQDRICQN